MDKSDQELIAEYLEGNDEALSVLVDRHLDVVFTFSLNLTHDVQIAEDVAQESFVKAWKNLRRFVPTKSFRTWLFAIARNTAIDKLRQKREVAFSAFDTATGENPLISTIADDVPSPSELIEKADDIMLAQKLLEKIDPLYRGVLILRYQNDMTFEQIGNVLKRPLHTVKSQHRRALASLRRALQTQAT